ncbi:MAG TPA: CpsD/CapB family tyrosine-protein kinase [Vicinamibacterales bacterium]
MRNRIHSLTAPDTLGVCDKRLVSLTAPASFAAEQYQGLRLTIERMARTRDVKVIAISSPAAGDGKTVTAINLAGALARGSDERVLLIDADLRRPSVARLFGVGDGELGLADALSDRQISLAQVVKRVDALNLSIVPAGAARRRISEILRSPRLDEILAEARSHYAHIVLDTPPLLPVFDSALLAKSVDGVLMVVAANQTPRKLLGESLNMVDATKVLGIVFNRDERPLFGYYNSYYREYFPDPSRLASEA